MSLWTFNLRCSDFKDDSDSDSDSDLPPDPLVHLPPLPASSPPSDDSKLLRDLDLASRHETVEFKANPWSIAKKTAASRPRQSVPEPPKDPPKSRGPIFDALRNQAKRAQPSGDHTVRVTAKTHRQKSTINFNARGVSSVKPPPSLPISSPPAQALKECTNNNTR